MTGHPDSAIALRFLTAECFPTGFFAANGFATIVVAIALIIIKALGKHYRCLPHCHWGGDFRSSGRLSQ
jgi:hypothetical protein